MSLKTFHFYLHCYTTFGKQVAPRTEANNRFIGEYMKALEGRKGTAKQAMEEAVKHLNQYEKQREEILNDMTYSAIVSSQMWLEEGVKFDDEAQWWHQMAKHHQHFKHELLVIHWRRERSTNVEKALNIAMNGQRPDEGTDFKLP